MTVEVKGDVATGTVEITGTVEGYVPHWATCPYAEEFRTDKQHNQGRSNHDDEKERQGRLI